LFNPNTSYAILGLARSGIAVAYKIKELGGTAYLSDIKTEEQIEYAEKLKQDFECEFGGHTNKLFQFEQWIVSPGIPLNLPIIQKAKQLGIPLICDIEFGYQIKSPDSKIIAVTGSNGKSTTVSLIQHILQHMGYNSILAGNIGNALTSYPIEKPGIDFIVLELSSFQLDLIDTFKPDVAVLLNITPDHLDRYDSFQTYIDSKFRIFINQNQEDFAVICLDSEPIAERQDRIKAQLLRYSLEKTPPDCEAWLNQDAIQIGVKHKLSVRDLKIRGPHNYANTMAALLAVNALTHNLDAAMEAAKTFPPLPHRLELVAKVNDIAFYNDSKATNTDAVKSALNAFDQPVRVIMGGSDKGEDFSVLTPLLKKAAKKVYLTGATADKMYEIWKDDLPLEIIDDFSQCIHKAFYDSVPGDIILLSPACASFDKFKNYEERGEVFKQIVNSIAREYEKE